MSKLHRIGYLIGKKSKKGNKYISGQIFTSSDKEKNVGLVGFPKESKKTGNKYIDLFMSVNEGETPTEALDRLIGEIERHKNVADKEWNNEEIV